MTNFNVITPGRNAPSEINVVIEIPKGSRVKYEIDPQNGILRVDRKLSTSMVYPGNYGFIPQTRTEDGDSVDVMVLDSEPLVPSCLIEVRPIGVLLTEDQDGKDSKILAVPLANEEFQDIQTITDIVESKRKEIEHFFEHHKELEKGKFIKILGWGSKKAAMRIIDNGVENYSADIKLRK